MTDDLINQAIKSTLDIIKEERNAYMREYFKNEEKREKQKLRSKLYYEKHKKEIIEKRKLKRLNRAKNNK